MAPSLSKTSLRRLCEYDIELSRVLGITQDARETRRRYSTAEHLPKFKVVEKDNVTAFEDAVARQWEKGYRPVPGMVGDGYFKYSMLMKLEEEI